jgi:hypothetical protein
MGCMLLFPKLLIVLSVKNEVDKYNNNNSDSHLVDRLLIIETNQR